MVAEKNVPITERFLTTASAIGGETLICEVL